MIQINKGYSTDGGAEFEAAEVIKKISRASWLTEEGRKCNLSPESQTTPADHTLSTAIHRLRVLAGLFGLAAITFNSCSALAAPTFSGNGWAGLKNRIDPLVEDVMEKTKILGMTVAVARAGKLAFSGGYGYASRNGSKVTRMTRFKRTRIGSTGKALITGPVSWKLLRQKGKAAATTRLYGPGGIFGSDFNRDYRIALARFGNISAIAISPSDKVYAWYPNKTVSIGTSKHLDKRNAPVPFKPAENGKVSDIRAIAISGSNSRVHTWYNTGALSIGTSKHLDRYRKITLNEKGKPTVKVKLPAGKSMYDVVGIAMAKSNDHVYAFYDDGTVSSGTPLDFTRFFVDRAYTAPSASLRYQIIDVGIAANDHLYVWYSKGFATSGTSRDLDRYHKKYAFTFPSSGSKRNPYPRITVQHLMDHKSGFNGSGNGAKTAIMLGKKEEDLTYADVHRHFLRTRALLSVPGTSTKYSNHGFGTMTLVIKRLSGRPYLNRVMQTYLKPLHLDKWVRPVTANHDKYDASSYDIRSGELRLRPPKNSTLGLAAGGWSASAESMLRLARHLTETYSIADMDKMGWGKNSKGALKHSGKTDGGAAYVVIFPEGYISNSGANIGNVHVAIASNTEIKPSALVSLANKIAVKVPEAAIPGTYSIWGKPAQVSALARGDKPQDKGTD